VLEILLERAGDVVTREELQSRIWHADTFVDFNHSLHNAVARIREALGDSAEKPRYIETLPRRGYRYVGPVEGAQAPPASADNAQATVLDSKVSGGSFQERRAVMRNPRLIVGALALLVVACVALSRMFSTPRQQSSTGGEILPLVFMPGQQDMPPCLPTVPRLLLPIPEARTPAYISR
jgi:hypothetical protein